MQQRLPYIQHIRGILIKTILMLAVSDYGKERNNQNYKKQQA